MRFDWSPEKATANYEKHGVPFEMAPLLWATGPLTMPSPRAHSTEARHIALGEIGGVLVAMVYVMREIDLLWVISIRRASRRERRDYAKH